MNNNKLLIICIFFLSLTSCGVVKEGFKSPKQNKSDEFLVEKKSPLIMPPEFNELPIPDNNQKSENNEETDIKKLITNNENSSTENISNQNTNFENSILEKIKNN